MKRLFLSVMFLFAVISSGHAEEKTMTIRSDQRIHSVEASFSYDVFVTYGTSRAVKIEYDEIYEPYIKAECISGKLYLRVEELPAKLRISERAKLNVYLEMTDIDDLDLSGSAEIIFDGEYDAADLDIDLSGASRLSKLDVSGESLSLDCSGASKFDLTGDFADDVDMDLSGAVNASLVASSPELEVDMSGASKIFISGKFSSADLSCSGAGTMEVEGQARHLSVECSGASNCEAKDFEVKTADVELTGAGKAKVCASDSIVAKVSRASKLIYYGDPEIETYDNESSIIKGSKPLKGVSL